MTEPQSHPASNDVVERAAGPEAQARWRASLEDLYDAVMKTPVGALLDPSLTADAVEAALSPGAIDHGARPAARLVFILLLAQLKDDKRRFGDYVPEGGREALEELATRGDAVPERLIHEVFEDEAAREVMADLISHAIREFQDKVNPFFAEWGLPALLKKLGPFGLGGMSKAFDSLRGEVDRRFEPELRRFLSTFTARGAKRASDYITDHAGDKSFLAWRKRIVRWMLDQTVADTVERTGEPLLNRGREVFEDIAAHAATLESVRARRKLIVAQLVALHSKQPLGAALAQYGITARPDFDVAARLSWPFVRAALTSDAGRLWLSQIESAPRT